MGLFHLFFAILLCLGYTRAADHCAPGLVPNISLGSDYTLNWSEALNPNNCTIFGYVINIFDLEDNTNLQFQTTADVFNYSVSFLDMCTTYSFEVHALTNQFVLGPSLKVNGTTGPSEGMNLGMNLSKTSSISNTTEMQFSWIMNTTAVTKCISYYRVVYWDENNNPTDLYVTNQNFFLSNMIPCMTYTIQVNAIITNPDLIGPTSETTVSGPHVVPNVPRLVNMTTGSNSATMFWKVPQYNENRCQLTSMSVYTPGAPANSSSLTIPINDSPLRPDVQTNILFLSPDNVYTSIVSLKNSYGSSRNITVSYQTNGNFMFNYEEDY